MTHPASETLHPAPVEKRIVREIVPLWRIAVIIGMTGITLALCFMFRGQIGMSRAGVILTLPHRVGEWWGVDQAISLSEKTLLPSDTTFARKNYESLDGDSIMFSIVLSGADKRSIHRPEICLPGQGWTIHGGQVVPILLHSGRTLQAMNLTLSRPIRLNNGQQKEIYAYYMYWFVGDGVETPNHWMRLWLASWDRVVHHVNHRWAYVIVNSMITQDLKPRGKDPVETLAMMKDFVADIVPSFQITEGATENPPANP